MPLTPGGWAEVSQAEAEQEPIEVAMRALNGVGIALEVLDEDPLLSAAFALIAVTPSEAVQQAEPDAAVFAAAVERLHTTVLYVAKLLARPRPPEDQVARWSGIARDRLMQTTRALEAWSRARQRKARAA